MTTVEQLELEVRTHKARADHAEKSRERAWAETIELKKRVAELEKAEIVTLAGNLMDWHWQAGESWVRELDVRGFEMPPIGSTEGPAGHSLDTWRALLAHLRETAARFEAEIVYVAPECRIDWLSLRVGSAALAVLRELEGKGER